MLRMWLLEKNIEMSWLAVQLEIKRFICNQKTQYADATRIFRYKACLLTLEIESSSILVSF